MLVRGTFKNVPLSRQTDLDLYTSTFFLTYSKTFHSLRATVVCSLAVHTHTHTHTQHTHSLSSTLYTGQVQGTPCLAYYGQWTCIPSVPTCNLVLTTSSILEQATVHTCPLCDKTHTHVLEISTTQTHKK